MEPAPSRAGLLWENPNPTASYMWEFLQKVNKKYHLDLSTYDHLYDWSIDRLPEFWEEVWAFTGVRAVSGLQDGQHLDEKKPFKHVSKILVTVYGVEMSSEVFSLSPAVDQIE
jgi:hypothetical protein